MRPHLALIPLAVAAVALPASSASAAVTAVQSSSLLTTADFNGDGRVDLAASGTTNEVRIRLGDGTGGFRAARTVLVRGGAGQVIAADVNRDRRLDLAVTTGAKRVAVFLGDGKGGFRAAPGGQVKLRHDPWSVSAGRFDRDRNVDLAFTGVGASLMVLRGDGTGRFRAAAGNRSNSCPYCYDAAAADMNSDGYTDLITPFGHGGGGIVTNVGGARDGRMPRSSGPKGATGRYPFGVTLADFDRDGRLDAGVLVPSLSRARILLGDGRGGFPRTTLTPKLGKQLRNLIAGDVNGDGRADLVTKSGNTVDLDVLLGDGRGGFTRLRAAQEGGAVSADMLLAPADVNGDRRTDIVELDLEGHLGVRLGMADGALGPVRGIAR